MKTVQFDGQTFEYDERAPKRWSVQKALALGESDPAGFYGALDKIFAGRSDEYAERLGDESERMLALLDVISKAVGAKAKN
jgi:hypothetical protein